MTFIRREGDGLAVFDANGRRRYAVPHPGGYWLLADGAGDAGNPGGNGGGTNPNPGGGGNGRYITAQMIIAATESAGVPWGDRPRVGTADQIADAFNAAISARAAGEFVGKNARAALVGQCAQESGWYNSLAEYGLGAGKEYWPYYGRGFIQLTWRGNYAEFGEWDGVGSAYVDDPDKLLSLDVAGRAAIFYFTQRFWGGHNLCWWSENDPGAGWAHISRAINCGAPWVGPAGEEGLRAAACDAALAVCPDVSGGGGGGNPADPAVKWMLDHLGQFAYTWDAWARTHMPESGAGDCSSTVITAYVKTGVCTVEQMGGLGYTGTLAAAGTLVCDGVDESIMRPGDLILIDWDFYNPTWTHVEMYIGDGKMCGHGGGADGSLHGPVISPLVNPANVVRAQVRRYV